MCEGIVEGGKVNCVLGAVADVVDTDPDGDEGFGGGEESLEDGGGEGFELVDLIDEGDGEVVMKRCAIWGGRLIWRR